jgi:hypothetical protein
MVAAALISSMLSAAHVLQGGISLLAITTSRNVLPIPVKTVQLAVLMVSTLTRALAAQAGKATPVPKILTIVKARAV